MRQGALLNQPLSPLAWELSEYFRLSPLAIDQLTHDRTRLEHCCWAINPILERWHLGWVRDEQDWKRNFLCHECGSTDYYRKWSPFVSDSRDCLTGQVRTQADQRQTLAFVLNGWLTDHARSSGQWD